MSTRAAFAALAALAATACGDGPDAGRAACLDLSRAACEYDNACGAGISGDCAGGLGDVYLNCHRVDWDGGTTPCSGSVTGDTEFSAENVSACADEIRRAIDAAAQCRFADWEEAADVLCEPTCVPPPG